MRPIGQGVEGDLLFFELGEHLDRARDGAREHLVPTPVIGVDHLGVVGVVRK